MASLRKAFFDDLGTKLLALILALAIYVHVFSGQEREGTFRIPLSVAPLPSGLALAGNVPSEARVRVRATGADLVKLSTRDFSAEVKVEEPKEGTLQRPLLGSDVRFPRGVKPIHVDVITPRVLNLQIEPTTKATIPVMVRLGDPFPSGWAMAKQPEAIPATIVIEGVRSLVSALDSVETVPVALDPSSGRQDQLVALRLPPGIESETDSVEVQIRMEERQVARYGPYAVELLLPHRESLIWVHPDSGVVVLSGAPSIIGRVNSQRIRLLADLRGRGGGSRRVGLRAIVPGLSATAPVEVLSEPESVSVRLQ